MNSQLYPLGIKWVHIKDQGTNGHMNVFLVYFFTSTG